MMIIEKNYKWSGNLTIRTKTTTAVLHHRCGDGTAESIHTAHLKNGWAGIGYHFYVRKDGSIHCGRPINTIGAHASGNNSNSLGICFEGNFENEKMNAKQLKAGQDLIRHLKTIYPKLLFMKHSDLNATACPGKYFPFDKIVNYDIEESSEIVKELNTRGIMTNFALWSVKCASDTNSYWLARKICNMTKNSSERANLLKTVNDIVWELNYRGIITDKALWMKLFKEDEDLYWLGYKAANMTQNL